MFIFNFIAGLSLLFVPLFTQAQTVEKTISVSQPREKDSRYFYVPFDVPKNVKSLTISYEYDKKGGANVLDLGVFDARFDAAENNIKGLRGWSGGRRSTIFIEENSASHGYVAGEIQPGTWRVILGLYKVAPEGVDVAVKIKFNEIDRAARAEFDAEKAKTFEFPVIKKFRVELERLNVVSRRFARAHFLQRRQLDDKSLLDYAANNNLDFIGITEHNTFAHHAEINALAGNYKNLLVLRGEEVTTYGGHFNVWGLPTGELIDFRIAPKDVERLSKSIGQVRQMNLLASLNHPTALCGGCDWSYADWEKMDSVEIWNGAWDSQDEAALKKWDELLRQGKRITAIGSSDSHAPPVPEYRNGSPLGTPTTNVGMKNLTQTDLLAAIKAGRVWVSASPAAYDLEFSAFNGSRVNIGEAGATLNGAIRFDCRANNFPSGAIFSLISNGQVLQTDKIQSAKYKFVKEFAVEKDTYFRLEVRDANGAMLALTNPIYIKTKR